MFRIAVFSLALAASTGAVWAQEAEESKVLKEALARFQDAYNAHDVEAMTGSWADDVDFISADGVIYEGREAIADLYREQFEQSPDAALATEVFRVRVLGDAAIVDGSANFSLAPDEPAQSTRFTAVYSRKDDGWSLVSLRESALPDAPDYDKLQGLAWLAGDWIDDSEDGRKVFTTIAWSETGDELRRTSIAPSDDGSRRLIESRVYWNPTAQRVESRTRDGDRIVCGVWSQEGDAWIVSTTELDENGDKATARYRMAPNGENEMTVQSLGGESGDADASSAKTVKRLQ